LHIDMNRTMHRMRSIATLVGKVGRVRVAGGTSKAALSQLQFPVKDENVRTGVSPLFSLTAAFAALLLSASASHNQPNDDSVHPNEPPKNRSNTTNAIYTIEEVAKHKTKATGVWVIYKDGVYDITKFVANHPGGQDKIMLAAGGDIAPFWNLYRQHYNSSLPMEILSSLRIGSLSPEDVRRMEAAKSPSDEKDPYNNDPVLSPVMKYLSRKPINAEPPASLLTDNWVTPVDLWFVRNHHPVVNVPDSKGYSLSVSRESSVVKAGAETTASRNNDIVLNLSVEDVKTKFKPYTVVSTVQCGGNRRAEMSAIERTNGEISVNPKGVITGGFTCVEADKLHLPLCFDRFKLEQCHIHGPVEGSQIAGHSAGSRRARRRCFR
jgi:cytochrome b involved in lipid metabolism